MIDASALAFLGIVALLCILRIWWERAQHNREIEDARYRMWKGSL